MTRLQAAAEVVLCSGYVTQLLIGALLQAAGLAPVDPDGSLAASFVFALSLLDSVALLALMWWLLARRGERPRDVWMGSRSFAREAALGVTSFPLVIVVVTGVGLAVRLGAPWLRTVPVNPLARLLDSEAGLWTFLFVAIVAGGLREELQRAFLLHRFRAALGGAGLGLVVTSVAFGLGHTLQGWDAAVMTGALGALWGAMYLARGSAVAPIVSHGLFNSAELVQVFVSRRLAP
jgi:membrane protease YdiL (CAAX protease family)